MVPTLWSLAQVGIKTTSHGDIIGIMTTLGFQLCNYIWCIASLTISCHVTCRVLLGEEGMELDDAIGQLDLDIHALFCQMDVLCHFDDGESGWKEAARSVLCVCLSNRARHPGGYCNLSCSKVCSSCQDRAPAEMSLVDELTNGSWKIRQLDFLYW